MNSGKTLFAQLMACVPWTSFGRIPEAELDPSSVDAPRLNKNFAEPCLCWAAQKKVGFLDGRTR
jgi:hypothetical protein